MKHSAPSLPRRRAVRLGLVLTPVLAVALGTSVIWQTSYAAFSAQTANGTNNWNAGGVTLVDDDANSAMFNVNNIKPGDTGTKCITVTAGGSLPAAVKFYSAGTVAGTAYTTSNLLANSITLQITKGTGGTFSDCTGFTADAVSPTVFNNTMNNLTATNYGNGLSLWTTAGGPNESRTFRFTWTLATGAPTTTQNGTASTTFWWESQNT